MDYTGHRSPGQNNGVGSLSLLPDPEIELGSPALQVDSLLAEPVRYY